MGMSASQGRYMFLTARNSDITFELNMCANDKIQLTRETRAAAQEYQNAMNAKKYVWSTNQGATRQDLSYDLLMSPNASNNYQPYMVTDLQDRVVLNKKFADIAEKLSPDGKPFNWEANRIDVLAELTGIAPSRLNECDTSNAALEKAYQAMVDAEAAIPAMIAKTTTISAFISNTMDYGREWDEHDFKNSSTWADAYSSNDYIDLTLVGSEINRGGEASKELITKIKSEINNLLKPHFDKDADKFTSAADKVFKKYLSQVPNNIDATGNNIYGDANKYQVNVKGLIEEILDVYETSMGENINNSNIKWYSKPAGYDDKVKAYEKAKDAYNAALSSNVGLLTAEEEKLIEYYDLMFQTIAEKGWTYNSRVNDPQYLNEMFQNNIYTITTAEEIESYDTELGGFVEKTNFFTDIASNCSKLICVTDTDAQDEATIEYEYKKNLINEKETRIDTRMTDLQTELEANKQMMEGIKQVSSDNIERTFNIFT